MATSSLTALERAEAKRERRKQRNRRDWFFERGVRLSTDDRGAALLCLEGDDAPIPERFMRPLQRGVGALAGLFWLLGMNEPGRAMTLFFYQEDQAR